ncbi:Ribonuclease P protein subunit p21 [Choanephora cucurbitarum]|uniref:Ribonuclease P protein subunit p21 n=1 Tax=Choanephora cucurbitarum TaxID=101091 RepID=A0A1C7NKG9_9FUNG|nr:Ribonuclease P protein subunit p21 [Choanephora cucurbitarum]
MAKKDKKTGVNPKNAQIFERLSYLHQASMLMSTIEYPTTTSDTPKEDTHVKHWQGDPPGRLHSTSRYFNHNMKQITARLVLRLDPSIKRTVCKRCETSLLPFITSKSRIHSKPVPSVVQTCTVCKAKRRYTSQNPDHVLFNEKAVVRPEEEQ